MTIFRLIGWRDPAKPEERLVIRVFAGIQGGTLQLAGELRLDVGEWQVFGAALGIGADYMAKAMLPHAPHLMLDIEDPLAVDADDLAAVALATVTAKLHAERVAEIAKAAATDTVLRLERQATRQAERIAKLREALELYVAIDPTPAYSEARSELMLVARANGRRVLGEADRG